MKAIILAGGKGTRLEPYTTVFPKPLVPLGTQPIIDIIVQQLVYYGFKNITLSVGHLAELIKSYFQNCEDKFSHVNLSYVSEKEALGTAGSLSQFRDLDETFLVMNGDVLTSLDFAKLVDYHKEMGGVLTIGMHTKRVEIDLGVIETDGDNILTGYIEKPKKIYSVSMGVYIYEPAVIKYIEPGKHLDFPELVWRLLENKEKVVGYHCEDYWLDIGRHEDYIRAQKEFEQMKNRFLPGN